MNIKLRILIFRKWKGNILTFILAFDVESN